MRPRALLRSAAFALFLASPRLPAQFDQLSWSFGAPAGGSGSVTATSMTVTGPDDGPCLGGATSSFTTTVPIAGIVTVSYSFWTEDEFHEADYPVLIVDGVETELDDPVLVEVAPGTSLGFGVHSIDCIFGAGHLDLTDFQFFPLGETIAIDGEAPDEALGSAVTAVGDLNGDGVGELVVGAPGASLHLGNEGVVRIFSGADLSELLVLAGDAPGQLFGTVVEGVGDVDDDGIEDIAVGVPYADTSLPLATDAGVARVFSGATGGELLRVTGQSAFDKCGSALASVGDWNADGRIDIAVGSPFHDEPASNAGVVRVVSGVTGEVLVSLSGVAPGDGVGSALTLGGDRDDDGLLELIAGAPTTDADFPDAGRVTLHDGPDGQTVEVLAGTATGERFGTVVDRAGDVDGDGVEDILAGAPGALLSHLVVGEVRVHSGADGGLIYAFIGEDAEALGRVAATAGDVNRDGWYDFLVGAPTEAGAGIVRVFSGRDGALIAALNGETVGDQFGASVAAVGDISGDDATDILLGVPGSDVAGPTSGRAEIRTLPFLWTDLGQSLAGTLGAPHLVGSGLLVPGLLVELELTHAKPSSAAFLVIGLTSLSAGFKGGVLVPSPDFVLAIGTGTAGTWTGQHAWPDGTPSGLDVWLQAWIVDAAAFAGFAASNGLRATVP